MTGPNKKSNPTTFDNFCNWDLSKERSHHQNTKEQRTPGTEDCPLYNLKVEYYY